jgi:hypothetical protein
MTGCPGPFFPTLYLYVYRNTRETLEERLDKFTNNAQHDCHTSIMMWLPIVGDFIVIGGGGGENDQLA